MEEVRVLCPAGALGTGIQEKSIRRGIELQPHVISCDAGSTDSGPYYLGSGEPKMSREALKRDLNILMHARDKLQVPLIIGSCGTSGTDSGVDLMENICIEIARESALHFKLALIYSELDSQYILRHYRQGSLKSLEVAPDLSEKIITDCTHIVGMMGHEPLDKAIEDGADIILAGRATDTALMAVVPLRYGLPQGPIWHAAKTMECGAACADEPRSDGVFTWIREDSFTIEPLSLDLHCSPAGIAAHTLYENADPYLIYEPSGVLDTSPAQYEAVSDRAVRVSKSRFLVTPQYTVKIEAAALMGYQTVIIGGVRDPYIIRQLDSWTNNMRRYFDYRIEELFGRIIKETSSVDIRLFGKDAVMGDREPFNNQVGHEIGIMFIVTSQDQETANKIAKFVSHIGAHFPIPEWKGIISSIAYPFSPAEIDRGPVYRFAMNHVIEIDDPLEITRFEYRNV